MITLPPPSLDTIGQASENRSQEYSNGMPESHFPLHSLKYQRKLLHYLPPVGIVLLMLVTGTYAYHFAQAPAGPLSPLQAGLLALVVMAVLLYEYFNGSHDAANSTAAIIKTRVLNPEQAGVLFAVMNTAGAVTNTAVAATIGHDIIGKSGLPIEGLIGAMIGGSIWSFLTLKSGRPTSSSHTLLSSLIGASIILGGSVQWNHVIDKIVIPMFLAIPIALGISMMTALIAKKIRHRFFNKTVNPDILEPNSLRSRCVQIITSSSLAFFHGSNDGQKGMGVIVLGLATLTGMSGHTVPMWVLFSCALAMGLGTLAGGFEVVQRLGHLFDINANARDGANAEGVAAAIIGTATFMGIPLSTTQVASMSNLGTTLGKLAGLPKPAHRLKIVSGAQQPIICRLYGEAFYHHLCELKSHLAKIGSGWIATIPFSMVAGALITYLLHLLIHTLF